MNDRNIKIGLVGIGEIARNQHIPSINKSSEFNLVAAASRNAEIDGVQNFSSINELLVSASDIDALTLCTPPAFRFEIACAALHAGKHVMLEKPPGATLSEVATLKSLAEQKNLTLFATWHSRQAPAVEVARNWLKDKTISCVEVMWREDVKHWHPGQNWIWQAGGMGVFDPGINALSILTDIIPHDIRLTSANLEFPSNCETPIAAKLQFTDHNNSDISAEFDWREENRQCWDIIVVTNNGDILLSNGGARIHINGVKHVDENEAEYDGLYKRFADLINSNEADVDISPLRHVADAFMIGRCTIVDQFIE